MPVILYTKTLYYKFLAESSETCSYETFTRHEPFNVKKASASDWGTCLCRTCLNPELKIEKLTREKLIDSINLENTINDDYEFNDFLDRI